MNDKNYSESYDIFLNYISSELDPETSINLWNEFVGIDSDTMIEICIEDDDEGYGDVCLRNCDSDEIYHDLSETYFDEDELTRSILLSKADVSAYDETLNEMLTAYRSGASAEMIEEIANGNSSIMTFEAFNNNKKSDIKVLSIYEDSDEIIDMMMQDDFYLKVIKEKIEDLDDYEEVQEFLMSLLEGDPDMYRNGDEEDPLYFGEVNINDKISLVIMTSEDIKGNMAENIKEFLSTKSNSTYDRNRKEKSEWIYADVKEIKEAGYDDAWDYFYKDNKHDYYIAYRGGEGYSYGLYYKDEK